MVHANHFTSIFTIFILFSSLISASQSAESGNWLTKSLDYYSLEKCSPLDKSGVTGDFYACLNSPVDSSSSTSPTSSPSGQGKLGSGDWSKFGSTAGSGGGFGSSSSSSSSSDGFTGKSGFNNFGSGQAKTSTSADSWPLSLVNDLQHMINCFPKLIKPCMTESEVTFFNTIKNFFQAQVNYASRNASLIATKIASSGCVKRNSIDTSTICYSTNIHKQNWFGWKINWSDGQMCRFIDDISKCEISSFDKCPSDVREFVDGLWEAGLRVTPCLDEKTTLSSPSPVITADPVDQTKSLAPGVSADSNQPPSRLTNVTNINSNDKQSLEFTVNNLTVNNIPVEPVIGQNREDVVLHKPLVSEQLHDSRFFDKMNNDNAFDGFYQNQQLDVNNQEENNGDFDDEVDERTRDFKGEMKHSKLVRLHEVEGEGESRHDFEKKHKNIAEEQWSRIKEEFRRKMRESSESRESDESEYEEESEESDEDKNFDIFENRKNHLNLRQRNEEDDYQNKRWDRKDIRGRKVQEQERQRRRNEAQAQRKSEEAERQREFEERSSKRIREMEKRRREEEERRREVEERREEEERRREEEQQRIEEENERMEKERENTRRISEERKRWEDENDNNEKTVRPERYLTKGFPVNRWENNNNNNKQRNHDNVKGFDQYESNINDCFELKFNSWSSLSKNHNSDDLMDLMCRNMDSIHTCLDKHLINKSNGQANRLGHLKDIHEALCDSNNRIKDNNSIDKVKQCLTDHSPSSSRSVLQTRYPNGASRLWH